MPLLCISLLVLLLLPLSLSCDSSPLDKISSDYMRIIQTQLQSTREEITTLLQNANCSVHRHQPRSCTPGNASSVNVLHTLTCKMKNLPLSYPNARIKSLISSVLSSMRCSCPEKPTKKPNVNSKRRRAATRRRRNDRTKKGKETRKFCRAKAILSAMTECYEMLNSL